MTSLESVSGTKSIIVFKSALASDRVKFVLDVLRRKRVTVFWVSETACAVGWSDEIVARKAITDSKIAIR